MRYERLKDHHRDNILLVLYMVYPTFNIVSIKKRCETDLIHFYDTYNISTTSDNYKDLSSLSLYHSNSPTADTMKASIDTKMRILHSIAGTNSPDDFDYAHDVIHLSDIKQKRLWIVRTFIFYELLTFITMTFSNDRLYNQVYKDTTQFPYRPDVVPELDNFKMGIFGSITPTSDIDIGFQYSGTTLRVPALAYLVSRFENAFLIFTGKNSLAFDIETYADMMTIPNPKPDRGQSPDYFYLDTSKFEKKHFQKVLVCAGTSMLRNAVLAEMDIQGRSLSRNEISDILDKFRFEDVVALNKVFSNFYDDIRDDLSQTWIKDAKSLVLDYMSSDYNAGRYKYYGLVDIAEKSKFKGTSHIDTLSTDEICSIMVNIGFSLTYRMESYNCAPTVIHVVRILQAAKEKAEKYKTLTPKSYCVGEVQYLDPYCSLGKYGYALSCMEQLGYINRFTTTYCIEGSSHYNKSKCEKKMGKYMGRFENGFFYFVQYYTGVISRGGRRFAKKYRGRSKQSRSTQPKRTTRNIRRRTKKRNTTRRPRKSRRK